MNRNQPKKEVIYAMVARGRKPLADFSEKRGSFDKFTNDILKKINTKPGQYILPYEQLEYIYLISPQDNNLIFLVLVEKGYKKETGFSMLDKMRTTFLDMFTLKRIAKAKSYSLSKEFRPEVRALIVRIWLKQFR
jgi:hypothetical protein